MRTRCHGVSGSSVSRNVNYMLRAHARMITATKWLSAVCNVGGVRGRGPVEKKSLFSIIRRCMGDATYPADPAAAGPII